MSLARKDLLGMRDLTLDEIRLILDTAESMKEVAGRDIKKVPTLRGKTVVNLFLESSTRTSTSFELAAKRLSADVVSIKGTGTSMDKGETLKDTILTLEAYDPDVFVIRHPQVGACAVAGRYTDAAVVNAGDGAHEEHACVFCRIAASGDPSEDNLVVWRGASAFVVMNAYPYSSGHVLVLPLRHAASLADARCDFIAYHCTNQTMSSGVAGDRTLTTALAQAAGGRKVVRELRGAIALNRIPFHQLV